MKNNMIKFTLLLMITICGFSSCKKIEVDQGITKFGEVYFDLTKAASYRSGNLQVRYNGNIIEMAQIIEGRIRVPEGEAKFEFLDKKSNSVLAEKTIVINSEKPEKYNLFQPSEEDGIAIFNTSEQENELAAPEGFIKIKIANYARKALPHDLIDIVVEANTGSFNIIDTLISIGTKLDEAKFILLKKVPDAFSYRFSYRVHKSQEPVLNARGTLYTSGGAWTYPDPSKNILTMYLVESHEADLENASNAAKGRGVIVDGKYIYRISPIILFAD